jgi:ADP-ribosylglycohydrolase
MSTSERLDRALLSLEGLSVGDAFGERFFVHRPDLAKIQTANNYEDLRRVQLEAPPWRWTDDTAMALSIVKCLAADSSINQDHLALEFSKRYVAEPRRGYGPAMHDLLPQLRHPNVWKTDTHTLFNGLGSFGNGAAMRVTPLGAYFSEDLGMVVEQARLSAEVSHAHPEGIIGAIATAVAAALATQSRGQPAVDPQAFIDTVLAHTPASEIANSLRMARDLPAGTTVQVGADKLGSGKRVTAQDTVPFVVWMAAWNLNDYEAAICRTISGLGDVDTTCAMVGGIVVMSTGLESIPEEWRRNREPLPKLF